MNKAMLIGRLTKDPELRATTSGISVCTFTLAVDRRVKQGEEKKADFLPVVAWRGQADNCAKYLHKGSMAGVSGSIQTKTYEKNDGSKMYITEIMAEEVQFLSSPQKEEEPIFREPMQPAEDEDLPF